MIKLKKLTDVAKDKSVEGRKSLVALLTDVFLEAKDTRGEQISLLFGDIVLKVLGQLEESARVNLAKRVCHEDDAPHELMVKLGKDEFTVAEPVLQNSPVLTPSDLAEIAASGSADHLGAIAGRSNLNKAVTSVLVNRGDATVLTKVTENMGAEIADASFQNLVERARTNESIQEALIDRPDLPDDAGRALLPMLTEELSKKVNSLGADNKLTKLIAENADTEAAAKTRKLEEAREQTKALIEKVVSGDTNIDEAVTLFARADRTAELGMVLAKVSELHPAAVSQLLFSKSDKPLIILCKANGVSDEAYKDILTMRARRIPIGGLELNNAIQRYAKMTEDGARRSLETLKESGEAFGLKLAKSPAEPEDGAPKKNIAFAVSR
ncbi:MAG: DUF2336 domain-containing protein [Roseibium sp.]